MSQKKKKIVNKSLQLCRNTIERPGLKTLRTRINLIKVMLNPNSAGGLQLTLTSLCRGAVKGLHLSSIITIIYTISL